MIYKIKITIFCIIIFIFGIGTVLKEKEVYSFYENRNYAKFPDLTISSIFNKSFFSNLEDYISGHFYKRDDLLELNIKKELLLKSSYINNIVIKDDILLPYYKKSSTEYNEENMNKMVNSLSSLNKYCQDNNINFLYVGVPEQSSALKDEYPEYLQKSRDDNNTFTYDFFQNLKKNNIHYINMEDYLVSEPLKYYSKTDHHYNFYGAYETYLKIMSYVKENFFDIEFIDNINIKKVDSEFIGSRNRKLYNLIDSEDYLYTYETNNHIPFEIYDNSKKVESTVFNENTDNLYNYYMGGDIGETIIKTNRPDLKNVLIIGDSFTNPLETILYRNFNETRSLDFRYYNEMNIFEYLKQYKPDLIIYVRDDLSYINLDGNGSI